MEKCFLLLSIHCKFGMSNVCMVFANYDYVDDKNILHDYNMLESINTISKMSKFLKWTV